MKCIFCLICGDLVALVSDETRYCKCGNVYGHYKNFMEVEVTAADTSKARLVGIDNNFLTDVKVPFDNKSYDGSMFQKMKSYIIKVPLYTTGDCFPLKEENIKPMLTRRVKKEEE